MAREHLITGPYSCRGTCWAVECSCGFQHHAARESAETNRADVELSSAWHLYEQGITAEKAHHTEGRVVMARAFFRSYVQDGRRAGQVRRLHIVREDGKYPGGYGFCSIHFGDVTKSKGVVIDPMPAVPPSGLSWCGGCLGGYAERVGLANEIAAILAAAEMPAERPTPVAEPRPPKVYAKPRGVCSGCGQERALNNAGNLHGHEAPRNPRLGYIGLCRGSRKPPVAVVPNG